MALSGIDCGPTLSPVERLTEEETAAVRKALEEIGYFEWKD